MNICNKVQVQGKVQVLSHYLNFLVCYLLNENLWEKVMRIGKKLKLKKSMKQILNYTQRSMRKFKYDYIYTELWYIYYDFSNKDVDHNSNLCTKDFIVMVMQDS